MHGPIANFIQPQRLCRVGDHFAGKADAYTLGVALDGDRMVRIGLFHAACLAIDFNHALAKQKSLGSVSLVS